MFLFLMETIRCDPSSEPSQRDSSDEGSQHIHGNHVVIPHMNRLVETVQIRGHNICFYAEITKKLSFMITKYSSAYILHLVTNRVIDAHPSFIQVARMVAAVVSEAAPKSEYVRSSTGKLFCCNTLSARDENTAGLQWLEH